MSKDKKVNNKKEAKEKEPINYWKIFFSVLIISISAAGAGGIAFGISQAKKAKVEKEAKENKHEKSVEVIYLRQIKGDE